MLVVLHESMRLHYKIIQCKNNYGRVVLEEIVACGSKIWSCATGGPSPISIITQIVLAVCAARYEMNVFDTTILYGLEIATSTEALNPLIACRIYEIKIKFFIIATFVKAVKCDEGMQN